MSVKYKRKKDCIYFDLDWLEKGSKDEILKKIYASIYSNRYTFFEWLDWYSSDLTINQFIDGIENSGSQIKASYEDYCRTLALDEFIENYEVIN